MATSFVFLPPARAYPFSLVALRPPAPCWGCPGLGHIAIPLAPCVVIRNVVRGRCPTPDDGIRAETTPSDLQYALLLIHRLNDQAAAASNFDFSRISLRQPKPECSRAFVAFANQIIYVQGVDGSSNTASTMLRYNLCKRLRGTTHETDRTHVCVHMYRFIYESPIL